MEKKIALIGIIIENIESAEEVNNILHEYNNIIIGRMGIPYREKNVSIISVVVDAENNIINALSGKLGKIKNVNVKTQYSKA